MVYFGTGISTAVTTAPDALRLAEQADRDGLDLFTVSDHPYFSDRLDAYAQVAVALGRTQRISGLVSVTNLPSRPAPMLARTVASLSALTGGRIVLGVGVGGLWDDIARLGVPKLDPAAAVEAFAEGITVLRALFGGGEPVTFDGRHVKVHALEPSPVKAPPIWTGSVGPRSLRVTGRLADGWIPGHAADWLSPRFRSSRPIIDEAATAAGRDPAEIATIYNLPGQITDRPLTRTRDEEGRWIGGSPDQWAEELTSAVRDHDAAGFVYFPPNEDPDQVARWAREVVPAIKQALQ